MLNFYRRFIKNAATTQAPLHDLPAGNTKEKTPLNWTAEAESAFVASKEDLVKATTLAHPKPNATISLVSDASNTAIGAVLQQRSHDS